MYTLSFLSQLLFYQSIDHNVFWAISTNSAPNPVTENCNVKVHITENI